jgi:drug/metabolite transporter (DMT)-like permease
MDTFVFMLLIACAALHATINCSLKSVPDPLAAAIMLAIGAGMVATPVLLLTGAPLLPAAPYLAVSVIIHIFYWSFLGKSYATGAVGVVFPLARGVAPVLTIAVTVLFFGEILTFSQWIAIAAIMAGIYVVLASGNSVSAFRKDPMFGNVAVVALSIAGYTLVDGYGARHAGSALAYTAFLYVANGWVLLAYGLICQRERLIAAIDRGWLLAVVTGSVSLGIYGAAVWAMTKAPIPLVATIREVSVLFTLVIATLWLKEPFRFARLLGGGIIVGGLAYVRMA